MKVEPCFTEIDFLKQYWGWLIEREDLKIDEIHKEYLTMQYMIKEWNDKEDARKKADAEWKWQKTLGIYMAGVATAGVFVALGVGIGRLL